MDIKDVDIAEFISKAQNFTARWLLTVLKCELQWTDVGELTAEEIAKRWVDEGFTLSVGDSDSHYRIHKNDVYVCTINFGLSVVREQPNPIIGGAIHPPNYGKA